LFHEKLSEAFPIFLGIHGRLDASNSQYGQSASAEKLKDEKKLLAFSKNAVTTAVGLDSQQKASWSSSSIQLLFAISTCDATTSGCWKCSYGKSGEYPIVVKL
jgi:hypothetical protein